MQLVAGTRLGTYEILGLLGKGGMGEVYRARDLRLGREVAVKILPADLASSPDRLARFEREARTVAGLNHPNIVVLHSIEEEEGVRFLTMELVEGRSLTTEVSAGGLPLPRILELTIPLTEALAAAHERGVVHRDLKPGNVMVTREGRVKVLDFGLAKATEPRGPLDESLVATVPDAPTASGQVVGTVPYMSPEQIRGDAVDTRSDLFALGILLYELATGRRPFEGDSAADIGSAILRDQPRPLGQVRSDLPPEFERIVERCLEKSPRERAQSALDVSSELLRLRRNLEQGRGGTPLPDQVPSIAVLPFVNRSRSEEDEYFSDGLADELLGMLAKIQGLRVSARASAFHFKGKDVPLAEIGRALNVAAVLDGSVRKAGNRVRISVQLVKVSDGYHLWSETYDRTLEDIFAVQDDIARSVVEELRTTLLGEKVDSEARERVEAEVAAAAKGRGSDPESYQLYLRARHLIRRVAREDLAKGIDYANRLVTQDPDFALAWAELSLGHAFQASQGFVPLREGYERARGAAERALALEPDLPEGHANLGIIRFYFDWDLRGAEASLSRALELAPGNASVLRLVGNMFMSLGRFEEGIALIRRAVEADPLSPIANHGLGIALSNAGFLTEAEGMFRKALELEPRRTHTQAALALTLAEMGRCEEALELVHDEQAEMDRPYVLAIVHHRMGNQAESDEALRELIAKFAETAAVQVACVYAERAETDALFEWLERAHVQRDPGLAELITYRYFRPFHGDPRWRTIMKKTGFPDDLN